MSDMRSWRAGFREDWGRVFVEPWEAHIGAILLVLVICGGLVIGIVVLLGPSVGNVFSSINASLK